MSRPHFYYSDALMRYNLGPHHPLKPQRLRMTCDLLESYGLFEQVLELCVPNHADEDEVAQVHSRDYLEILSALDRGEAVRRPERWGFGTGDNPIFPGMYDVSLLYTGASIDAAQAIIDGHGIKENPTAEGAYQVAFNITGGLHHAHYAKAAGFCVLNDCALGIRRLQKKFPRVAYVDIDVHHGDGVQELFYNDPSVLTISLHESGQYLFPGTGHTYEIGEGEGRGCSVNVPFAPFTTDEIWLDAWRQVALPILKSYDPDAILLQMGTDTHEFDPLAHLCLSAQGWLEAVRDVMALGKPIVAVGGGGYNLTTVPRMWTLAVATLAGVTLPDEVPATYRHRDRIPTLNDHHLPVVEPGDILIAREFARIHIEEIKSGPLSRYF